LRRRCGVPDDVPLCPECLAQVHPDWPFCSHCGSRLNPSSSSVTLPAHAVYSPASTAPPGSIPVCGNCGAAVDTTGSFCWKCGLPLVTGREPFIPAHPESADQPGTTAESVTVPVASIREQLGGFSTQSARRTPASKRAIVGGTLLLVGVALLLVSLFVGWYGISASAADTVSGSSFTISGTATYYPLNQLTETITCQGSSYCYLVNSTYSGPYAQGSFNSLGTLYNLVADLVIGGVIIGLAAASLAFTSGRKRSGWAGGLAIIAIILVVLAPTLLFAAQPAVLNSQGSSSGGSSPRSSFFGSCAGSGCGSSFEPGETISASWGPSIGWYLGLAAIAPLLAGLFVVLGKREGSPDRFVYEQVD